ncbi:DUF4190 domain-containing protein [Occultella glacieicola]|uniref:DUF4190 domain-containing protein n=1 Tax=Occultella glacieicola TaxID=2518684 RepID=UPI001404296C|nr:DUF4190 domain-containing protein [Occultella glacieicola]
MSYPPVPPSSGGVNPYDPQEPYESSGSGRNQGPTDADRSFVEGPQPWDTPAPGAYGQHQYGQNQYGQPQYGQAQYGQQGSPYTAGPHGYYGLSASSRNGTATTGLVLGIVGFFLACIPLVGLGLGIAAIVNGTKGRALAAAGQATNGGSATAAIVLGVIAVVGGIFWILLSLSQGYYG